MIRATLAILLCLLPVALFASDLPGSGGMGSMRRQSPSERPSIASGTATNTIDSQADGFATGLGHTPSSSSDVHMTAPRLRTEDPASNEGNDRTADAPRTVAEQDE